jgi:amidohydrolase
MVVAGALDNVRSIFALHVDPSRQTGAIGVRTGAFTAHCDSLRIRVHGRGGHGARPHE